jgi:hypothetical protein
MVQRNSSQHWSGAIASVGLRGLIINRDVTGWQCCSLLAAGLGTTALPTRCHHVSPLTVALHVVKVYVMCVCRGHITEIKMST